MLLVNILFAMNALINVENVVANVGLLLNANKTEVTIYNQEVDNIHTKKGGEDFKYIGS